MKYLALLVAALFLMGSLAGCATTTYSKDGEKITVTVKRPPFVASNASWSGDTGAIGMDTSTQLNQLLSTLTSLATKLTEMYGQSNGIPAKQ